ncbi:MAG: hypothetical protein HY039_13600 [Nitrospirae bacterium]|nr:hypothetical protein [Nitrospirota bacterium]
MLIASSSILFGAASRRRPEFGRFLGIVVGLLLVPAATAAGEEIEVRDLTCHPAGGIVVVLRNATQRTLPSGRHAVEVRFDDAAMGRIDVDLAHRPELRRAGGAVSIPVPVLKVNRPLTAWVSVQAADGAMEPRRTGEDPAGGGAFRGFPIGPCGSAAGERLPDLTGILKGPAAVQPGEEISSRLALTARNAGTTAVPEFTVDLVLSTTPGVAVRPASYAAFFVDGLLLRGGRVKVRGLAAGESESVRFHGPIAVPADTPPGTYYLAAVLDPGNAIPERSSHNNVALWTLTVLPARSIGVGSQTSVLSSPGRKQP